MPVPRFPPFRPDDAPACEPAGARLRAPRVRASSVAAACTMLIAGLASGAACAVVVPGLYEGTVPGVATEADRAALAESALRQVAVRVTGRASAANDPALAPLFAGAVRLVQTVRTVAGGQVTVGFDPAGVEAALIEAGRPLWSRDRPATLAVVVVERPGLAPALAEDADPDVLRAVEREALLRGVPIVWPGAFDSEGAGRVVDDVLAGRGDALLDLARRYDADGVLYGRVNPNGATRWNWLLPVGGGAVSGGAADGVDAVAERYAQAYTSGQTGAIALLPIVVTEARGLAGFTAAQGALESVPNVRGVQLERATADELTFRVNFRGDLAALRRAIASGGRLRAADGVEPGELRFALQP